MSVKAKIMKISGNIIDKVVKNPLIVLFNFGKNSESLKKSYEIDEVLINTIPFMISITDEEGNIMFMSNKLKRIVGSGAIGKKCWESYKDDKAQCGNCPLKKNILIGETLTTEVFGSLGGKNFKAVHIGMIFQGKKAVMEIFRDITKQKTSEELIEEGKVYAESIVNTVRIPLVVLDFDFRIISANWFFYYKYKFLEEKTEGKIFYSIYDSYWDIPELREKLKILVEKNIQFHDFEIKHEFPYIGKRIVSFTARRIYQVGIQNQRILLSIIDITDRRLAEDELKTSEEKYRNLFDNASDAIITLDLNDKITSWNASAERILGWTKKEAIGKKFSDLAVSPGLREERENIVEDVLKGSKVSGIETVRLRKDGVKINVSLVVSPILNADKKIIGISGIIRDITSKKEEEKRLKIHAETLEKLTTDLEKFKLAVEKASDLITIVDSKGFVIYVNEAVNGITGYTKKEIIGKKAKLIWGSSDDGNFYHNLFKRVVLDKKNFTGEFVSRKKNGEKYYTKIRVSPILDEARKPIFFVGIETDVTAEKEIDRAKTEFVSVASHELRTPLANMSLSLDMILGGVAGVITKEQKKYLRGVYKDIEGMAGLIDALLNVSRIELRTMIINPEPTNISDIAARVMEEVSPQIRNKGLKLKTSYDKFIPVVELDRNLVRIIFQNLISNAIKYTPSEGSISVVIKKKKSDILIEVSDTGCGIPEEEKDKVFLKMFRAKNARETKNDGIGLGLYIVSSIIEKTGGRIWFDSKENSGTTFYVTIPLVGMKKGV